MSIVDTPTQIASGLILENKIKASDFGNDTLQEGVKIIVMRLVLKWNSAFIGELLGHPDLDGVRTLGFLEEQVKQHRTIAWSWEYLLQCAICFAIIELIKAELGVTQDEPAVAAQ